MFEAKREAPMTNQQEVYEFLGRSKRLEGFLKTIRESAKEVKGKDLEFSENVGLLDDLVQSGKAEAQDGLPIFTLDTAQRFRRLVDSVSNAAKKSGFTADDIDAQAILKQWDEIVAKGDAKGTYTTGRELWGTIKSAERAYESGQTDFLTKDTQAVKEIIEQLKQTEKNLGLKGGQLVTAFKNGVVRMFTGSTKGGGVLSEVQQGVPQVRAKFREVFGEGSDKEIDRILSREKVYGETDKAIEAGLKSGAGSKSVETILGQVSDGLPIVGKSKFYSTMGGLFATGSSLMDALTSNRLPTAVVKEVQRRLTSGSSPEEVARMFRDVIKRRKKAGVEFANKQSQQSTGTGVATGIYNAIKGDDPQGP